MNYLAHAYLSFHQPEVLVGNIISDFVKGRTKFNYPQGIQNGIALHRKIDEFTDAHPATKKAASFFRPAYRLYSGAFVDVIYDHFLALDKKEFAKPDALHDFTTQTYHVLDENFSWLPERFQSMFPHMKQHNWLYNYQYHLGIERSFGGLVRRAAYITECETAYAVFNENYNELKECYQFFFPTVKKFSQEYLSDL